jgi:hypothetical protein
VAGSWAGSGVVASVVGSAARHALALGCLDVGRGSQVILGDTAGRGVTLKAVDPASTSAWSCLVVAGGSSAPLLPGGSRWWPTSGLGVATNDSSLGLW